MNYDRTPAHASCSCGMSILFATPPCDARAEVEFLDPFETGEMLALDARLELIAAMYLEGLQ